MTLDQLVCGLFGHDYFTLVRSPGRLAVQCDRCRKETPGIEVGQQVVARGPTKLIQTWGSTASTD